MTYYIARVVVLILSLRPGAAQIDDRHVSAETHGHTICAQADDGELGIAWHYSDGFEQILFLCQVFHLLPDKHLISLQETINVLQAGNGDTIIFDSDFTINQGCSFVAILSASPSADDDGTNTMFDITSNFKDVIGDCPASEIAVSGTLEITDNGFGGSFDFEFSGDPTGDEDVGEIGEVNIPFGSVSFPPINIADRSVSMETAGETGCAQADDGEAGIVWHISDGFNGVLYVCQVFYQKSQGGALISLAEAIELMRNGNADDIIFDTDITVTQDCSFVALLAAALSSHDKGQKTLFDVTSTFKNVVGNCPRDRIVVSGTIEIIDQTLLEDSDSSLQANVDFTFAGDAVALSPLEPITILAETQGRTVCEQRDDGEQGIAWHFSDGFDRVLFMCQVYHQKSAGGALISLLDAIALMQQGNADDIVFDSDFVVSQDCSFVSKLAASVSDDDDGSLTSFDISSMFKDVEGACPNSALDIGGTMQITNGGLVGLGFSAAFDANFSGDSHVDPEPTSPPAGAIGGRLMNRTLTMQTHGNTGCQQADDHEEGIAWHFSDGFQQVLFMCQAFHQKSKDGKLIQLSDVINLLLDGKEDDVIFDSDFVVTQECSFVAKLAAALSPMDDGSHTLFDITSDFKDVVGDCPNSNFDATGTMEIVDNREGEDIDAGFNSNLDVSFSGDAVDNGNGGNGGDDGGSTINKLLLGLSIVFGILFLIAAVIIIFCYRARDPHRYSGQPRQSEMRRADNNYNKLDADGDVEA